jgi:hypothetical protein
LPFFFPLAGAPELSARAEITWWGRMARGRRRRRRGRGRGKEKQDDYEEEAPCPT